MSNQLEFAAAVVNVSYFLSQDAFKNCINSVGFREKGKKDISRKDAWKEWEEK